MTPNNWSSRKFRLICGAPRHIRCREYLRLARKIDQNLLRCQSSVHRIGGRGTNCVSSISIGPDFTPDPVFKPMAKNL